MMISNSL